MAKNLTIKKTVSSNGIQVTASLVVNCAESQEIAEWGFGQALRLALGQVCRSDKEKARALDGFVGTPQEFLKAAGLEATEGLTQAQKDGMEWFSRQSEDKRAALVADPTGLAAAIIKGAAIVAAERKAKK